MNNKNILVAAAISGLLMGASACASKTPEPETAPAAGGEKASCKGEGAEGEKASCKGAEGGEKASCKAAEGAAAEGGDKASCK